MMEILNNRQRMANLLFENGEMCKDQFIDEMWNVDHVAADICVMRGDIIYSSIIN